MHAALGSCSGEPYTAGTMLTASGQRRLYSDNRTRQQLSFLRVGRLGGSDVLRIVLRDNRSINHRVGRSSENPLTQRFLSRNSTVNIEVIKVHIEGVAEHQTHYRCKILRSLQNFRWLVRFSRSCKKRMVLPAALIACCWFS